MNIHPTPTASPSDGEGVAMLIDTSKGVLEKGVSTSLDCPLECLTALGCWGEREDVSFC